MDIKRKIELLELGIASIAGHVDEDGAVRQAALQVVEGLCVAARVAVDVTIAAEISALTSQS